MSKSASAVVSLPNKLGLHARPAIIFVEAASKLESDVTVRRCDQGDPVDGKSIMQMMMLAATRGTELEIAATGVDADEAFSPEPSRLLDQRSFDPTKDSVMAGYRS